MAIPHRKFLGDAPPSPHGWRICSLPLGPLSRSGHPLLRHWRGEHVPQLPLSKNRSLISHSASASGGPRLQIPTRALPWAALGTSSLPDRLARSRFGKFLDSSAHVHCKTVFVRQQNTTLLSVVFGVFFVEIKEFPLQKVLQIFICEFCDSPDNICVNVTSTFVLNQVSAL